MAAAAECILGRTISRGAERTRALEVVEPVSRPDRQDRDDSPLLHPNAGAALALAATPLEDGPRPVALVLEDGTIRSLHAPSGTRRFATGTLAGPGWTLWWERRVWARNA